MEGLVQPVQLRQRFNQLRDVVLHVLLSEEPREEIKIFGESINKLFFHTVGIGKPDISVFRMVDLGPDFKWFSFQMVQKQDGCQITSLDRFTNYGLKS